MKTALFALVLLAGCATPPATFDIVCGMMPLPTLAANVAMVRIRCEPQTEEAKE